MYIYLRTLQEIYRAFEFFNNKFTDGYLKTPIISISSNNGIDMHGWFGPNIWKHGNVMLNEINLSAEGLNRTPKQFFGTLLHEMAHLRNYQLGIEDIDCDTQYHNTDFKISAQSMGLKVRWHKQFGYSTTWCDSAAVQAIEDLKPDYDLICNLYRQVVDMSTTQQWTYLY